MRRNSSRGHGCLVTGMNTCKSLILAAKANLKVKGTGAERVRMPLLPSINLQRCSQRDSSRHRALRQAVSRPKGCRCTCFRPCLPHMWHRGPVGERVGENTKQTQEAWWQNLSKNAMAGYVRQLCWAWLRMVPKQRNPSRIQVQGLANVALNMVPKRHLRNP